MQGKFEKNIEQQLSDFSLEPSPQIWKDVEAALHPHRKNRGILWWWVPLMGLLMTGGVWWLFSSVNEAKNNIPSTISQNKKAIKDNTVANNKQKATVTPAITAKENKKESASKDKTDDNSVIIQLPQPFKNTVAEKKTVLKENTEQKEIRSITKAKLNQLIKTKNQL